MKKLQSFERVSRESLRSVHGGGTNVKARACPPFSCVTDWVCNFHGGVSCKCPFFPVGGQKLCSGF